MRRRAFIPDLPGALEGRAAPSGGSGPAHLSGLGLDLTLSQIKGDFQQYALSGQLTRLRTQLSLAVKSIPFGRSDGLGGQVGAALQRMQAGLAPGEGASRPIAAAYSEITTDIGNIVKAHVADGTLVINPY